MNTAASLARGEWLIFLNAGDTLLDENVLSEALEGRSTCSDFIVGHYLESRGDGEHMHWVSDFDDTWERLRAGKLDPTWFARLPTLAATLINKRILQKHHFSRRFQHAAHLDLFLRCRRDSARFHHANTTIARIAAKPRRQSLIRIAECRRIFSRETTNVPSVRVLSESLRATECEPLLRSWIHLGPQKLCANLMRDPRNGAIRSRSGMEASMLSRNTRSFVETTTSIQDATPLKLVEKAMSIARCRTLVRATTLTCIQNRAPLSMSQIHLNPRFAQLQSNVDIDKIGGFLARITAVWDALLEYQENHYVLGHLGEIVFYKGKSAAILAHHQRAGEQLWLVDFTDFIDGAKINLGPITEEEVH